MSNKNCILTRKDFAILEILHQQCLDGRDPLSSILRRKIDAVCLVEREEMPANVASLNSRVSFRVDEHSSDTRTIVHDWMTLPVGMALPITTQRGLALIGLVEGQEFRLINRHGIEESLVLERVHYQPEAANREQNAGREFSKQVETKDGSQLIRGDRQGRPRFPSTLDDPGPSAA